MAVPHTVRLGEDDLRRFLPLLGIPTVYAYLNYHHAAEFTPEELAAEGIRLVAHLIRAH